LRDFEIWASDYAFSRELRNVGVPDWQLSELQSPAGQLPDFQRVGDSPGALSDLRDSENPHFFSTDHLHLQL
jgi:hypothetical protein